MSERTILVVDDEPVVRRVLNRYLEKVFDRVLLADGPDEAENLLERHAVTHLVCDGYLGPGLPPGVVLVPGWRHRFPTIRRAVVFSASDFSAINLPEEIDAVLPKCEDLSDLIQVITAGDSAAPKS